MSSGRIKHLKGLHLQIGGGGRCFRKKHLEAYLGCRVDFPNDPLYVNHLIELFVTRVYSLKKLFRKASQKLKEFRIKRDLHYAQMRNKRQSRLFEPKFEVIIGKPSPDIEEPNYVLKVDQVEICKGPIVNHQHSEDILSFLVSENTKLVVEVYSQEEFIGKSDLDLEHFSDQLVHNRYYDLKNLGSTVGELEIKAQWLYEERKYHEVHAYRYDFLCYTYEKTLSTVDSQIMKLYTLDGKELLKELFCNSNPTSVFKSHRRFKNFESRHNSTVTSRLNSPVSYSSQRLSVDCKSYSNKDFLTPNPKSPDYFALGLYKNYHSPK